MRLDKFPHHGKPDAASAFDSWQRDAGLDEQAEYPREHRGLDADARITNPNPYLLFRAFHRQRDVSAIGRVLGRVDQQIREGLLQTRAVPVGPDWLSGQGHQKMMPTTRHLGT